MPELARFFGIVIYMNWQPIGNWRKRVNPSTALIRWSKIIILHTTDVKPLPGCRLFMRFNHGIAGEVDLRDELQGEMFDALRDPVQFGTAYQHPVMRTAAWANGADLALEFLLDLLERQRQMAARTGEC